MAEPFTIATVVKKVVKKELDAYSLGPGASVDVDISVPGGKAALAITLRAAYNTAATAGVRLSVYYSADGANWDTDTDEVYTHPFGAGETRQKTYLLGSVPLYVRIRVENLDTTYSVTINLWRSFV